MAASQIGASPQKGTESHRRGGRIVLVRMVSEILSGKEDSMKDEADEKEESNADMRMTLGKEMFDVGDVTIKNIRATE